MLKETITYEDFDGNMTTETLHFNISKSELTDHLYLEGRFQSIHDKLTGPAHTLTAVEVQEILDLVKTVLQMSYGIRSEDGKRFRKSAEIWQDFKDSAAYDAYLYSLFENPEKATGFLLGVLPKDLREAAEKEVAGQSETSVAVTDIAPPVAPKTDAVSDEELLKMDPKYMTHEQLVRAMQLRNK